MSKSNGNGWGLLTEGTEAGVMVTVQDWDADDELQIEVTSGAEVSAWLTRAEVEQLRNHLTERLAQQS